MLAESKNIKDIATDFGIAIKDTIVSVSYGKTNKLITALYMVTDVMDKEEPIRNKLRTLGVEILSDTISKSKLNLDTRIQEVLSFLDICSAMNIISEMNCGILRKEFLELKNSFVIPKENPVDLNNFFAVDKLISPPLKGHTRIGVQKGSTLMQALSDRISAARPNMLGLDPEVKKQRRDSILAAIKGIGGNAAIKDVRIRVPTLNEKTLQRELMSMVKDNVLNKTGKKRWSRYKLVNLVG